MKYLIMAAIAIAVVIVLAVIVRTSPTSTSAQQPQIVIPDVAIQTANPPATSPPPSTARNMSTSQSLSAASLQSNADPKTQQEAKPAFVFADTAYFHRFTHENHREYTPAGQENLKVWKDMVTIIRNPSITDPDMLAKLADAMLDGAEARRGQVLRVDSVPAADKGPAEHLLVVVLGDPGFLEAVFTRFIMHDNVGTLIMYGHRVYGRRVGDEMSRWLSDHGPAIEAQLMKWNDIAALP